MNGKTVEFPTLKDLNKAYEQTRSLIHRTPVLRSSGLDRAASCQLFFKCENFQRTGSYKFRGALYAVKQLSQSEQEQGVTTHSSGNFAQALALTAKLLNLSATIVMPENAPGIKKQGVIASGAKIVESGPTLSDREMVIKQIIKDTNASFIHPSNDLRVITGHSSIVYELLEDIPDLDVIIAPVGGGGIISSICLAANYLNPSIKIIGAEPKNADDAYRSLKAGKIIPVSNPQTIADGLRTSLGDKNFPIIKQFVERIILVEEEEIVSAMRLLWERLKIIVEPSSSVTLAAILKEKEVFRDQKIGLILTGGNVDLDNLPF